MHVNTECHQHIQYKKFHPKDKIKKMLYFSFERVKVYDILRRLLCFFVFLKTLVVSSVCIAFLSSFFTKVSTNQLLLTQKSLKASLKPALIKKKNVEKRIL